MTLAALWWDGTALASGVLAPIDYGSALNLSGLAVSIPVVEAREIAGQALAVIGANTAYTVPSNMGSAYFTVATPTRVRVGYNATLITTCPIPGKSYVSTAAVIGNSSVVFNLGVDYTGATHALVGMGKTDTMVVPPGLYQFTVKVQTGTTDPNTAGSSGTAIFDVCKAQAELTRGT